MAEVHNGCYNVFNAMESLIQEQHRRIRDLESELLTRYQRIAELENALRSQGGLHQINASLTAERDNLLARLRQLEGSSIQAQPTPISSGPPFVGFAVKKTAGKDTIYVKDVAEGGPAEQAGLKDGDELIGLAGKPVLNMAAFRSVIRTLRPGQVVAVEFLRDDRYGRDNAIHKTVEMLVGSRTKPIIPNVPPMNTIGDLELILRDPARMERLTAFAFAEADDDCSLLVTREEFVSSIRKWIPPYVAHVSNAEIGEVFDRVDVDGSGFLTKSEFSPIVQALLNLYITYARRG